MTTFAPPSSFLTSQQGHPRPTTNNINAATSLYQLSSPQQPRRRVQLTNRYGNQRRPLPTPPTPIHNKNKKSVRFCSDNDLEHVRFFLKTQTPLAAAQDPLPAKPRWEIKYPGWPSKWAMYKSLANATTTAIKMEQVMLDNHSGMLKGRCRVANLAYEKRVVVRYSFDQWQTSQEHIAMYREPVITSSSSSSTATGWDRFTFDLAVPHSTTTSTDDDHHEETMTCWIALKYQVNGQTWWDNNDDMNYQLQLTSLPTNNNNNNNSNDQDHDDDNDDHDGLYHPALTPRSSPSSSPLHTGYQDFISKYCFYNNSSILQN
ncbi:putative phosphatase regulatory subunit-domain-containing protein [Absidia repens]|uniref:Putative phosphatase regulatory subunit-domain-containing protein n=1 Tax=Absidia repens TaxID=90262 RepID=A0A1X2I9S0_9FUNG|nr:putative phosphatase regulatory subunit-domain-containing protein [Absidia repens]